METASIPGWFSIDYLQERLYNTHTLNEDEMFSLIVKKWRFDCERIIYNQDYA